MALEKYREKRKFGVTPEPRGRKAKRGGDAFVIQKHAARQLHYDLRLELDGVMKSWAVARGPSLVPGEKRLAVHVEDHPIEYNSFEGTIPKGQYGGGTVMIWDRGRWIPITIRTRATPRGISISRWKARNSRGRWHLVRMRHRPGEKRDNWLLIKSADDAARGADDPDILQEKPKSVVSGRTLEAIAKAEGDAVWHSTRSVAENVKQIKKTAKKARKAVPRKKAARKAGKGRAGNRARISRPPRCCARSRRAGTVRAPFPISSRRSSRRCRRPLRTAATTSTRRNSTAIACRRGSRTARRSCSRARTLTGPPNSNPVADALAQLDAESALIDGEIVVEKGRRQRFLLPCRMRSSATRWIVSSITCSTSCISTVSTSPANR
jgi:bifunctional non-homologous end joining protein LigD